MRVTENIRIRAVLYTLGIAIAVLANSFAFASAADREWLPIDQGSVQSEPSVTIIEETPQYLLINFEFNGAYIQTILNESTEYERLFFKNAFTVGMGETGTPEIPAVNELIQLPTGTRATASVIDADYVKVGSYSLYPVQLPRRDDGSPQPEFVIDKNAYRSVAALPKNPAIAGRVQGWGGIPVSVLSVSPVRYFPATGETEIARSLLVRVDFNQGVIHDLTTTRNPGRNLLKAQNSLLLNPHLPDPRELDADEDIPVRMLFILKEEAVETAQPLIDFHHNTGHRTEIWLADDIEGPEEIRDRVRELFEEGLEYIFIIGDGYRRAIDVPMFFWDPEDPGWQDPVSTATHSDSWYTCLDEPDEDEYDDHLPELAIGRLVYDSVDEIDELEIQISKILNYYNWSFEEHRDGEWLGNALLMAHLEEDDDFGEDSLHYIACKKRIEEKEYEFPSPMFITAYGNEDHATNAFVAEQINNTGIGFLNYRGHGDDTQWGNWNLRREDIRAAWVRNLDNSSRPFILISSACKTANIATYAGDCLTEVFQKHDGGAVCTHGSVISTYTRGNHFFDERIWAAWFNDGVFDLGYSAVVSLIDMVEWYDNGAYPVIGRMNTRAFIWQGDPALEVKIEAPRIPDVDIAEVLPVGVEAIEAQVTLVNEELEGARFCIRSEDDAVYLAGYTDEEGFVTFELDEPIDEVMQLEWTVYHRRAIPISDEILVLDGFGVVTGRISDLATGAAIEEARISLPRFGGGTVTDANGNYRMEDVPATHHRIVVSAEGYISAEAEFDLEVDEVSEQNFELGFCQLETGEDEIYEHLQQGQSSQVEIVISNIGNGPLDWTASLDFAHENREPYEILSEMNIEEITEDTRINGVEFIFGNYYIAGGNRNADPNYIYIVSPEGEHIGTINQPVECAGIGMFDLAWDGEYIYGSSNNIIMKLAPGGEVEDTVPGPYNPNSAIAVDDEGQIWVSGNGQSVSKLDREGNVLQTIDNVLDIKALEWNSSAEPGYKLLAMITGEDGQPDLYRIDPDEESIRFIQDLSEEVVETPGYGFCIIEGLIAGEIELAGVVNIEEQRVLRLWHYDFADDWLGLSGESEGAIEGGEADTLTLNFDTRNYNNLRLEALLEIENNGREPNVEIPVTLGIGDDAVNDEVIAAPVDYITVNAYPNPFNATAQIEFTLPKAGNVNVMLYDIDGRLVREIKSGYMIRGQHRLLLEADRLPSGLYLLSVDAGNTPGIRKLVLMK